MSLEVIGAGFGRTGTNSLKLALEMLGFGPCHHMHEVATHTEQVPIWEDVAHGRRTDWESVFAGYRSQVDWPGARYWRELAHAFPAAKVILTVRPAEDWYRSFSATVGPELLAPPTSPEPVALARRLMQREIIAHQVFGDRPLEGADAIQCFDGTSTRFSAPSRPRGCWCSMSRTDGGRCVPFLELGPPRDPFPRTNSVREFHDGTWLGERRI